MLKRGGLTDEIASNILEKTARFPIDLEYAVGARVVMLKNTGFYVNGTCGVIKDIDEEHHIITVESDKGYPFTVCPETEDIHDAEGQVLVSHLQYPMQLAWAMTIHKAQGMTLDKIGIEMRNHFAEGMTYVAMSRVKTKEGLLLCGDIDRMLRTNKDAIFYMKEISQIPAPLPVPKLVSNSEPPKKTGIDFSALLKKVEDREKIGKPNDLRHLEI